MGNTGRLRILQISRHFPPHDGDSERVVGSLRDGLVEAGHQVTVLCTSHDPDSPELQSLSDRTNNIIRLPGVRQILGTTWSSSLGGHLEKLVIDHDIIHLHAPLPFAELSLLRRGLNKPFLVSHHHGVVRRKLLGMAYHQIYRRILTAADAIAVSHRNVILNSPILPDFESKIVAIPFGLPSSQYDRNQNIDELVKTLRARLGPFILYMGGLLDFKGLELLIHTMRKVPHRLVLVGDGPIEKSLRRLVKSLDVHSRVNFFPTPPTHRDRVAFLYACETLVLPSLTSSEAFGLPLIEAMACKKPIITTNFPGSAGAINVDRLTGYVVPPRDLSALADTLNRMMDSDGLRRRLGSAGLARFQEHFSQKQMVAGYENLYQQLITRHGTLAA